VILAEIHRNSLLQSRGNPMEIPWKIGNPKFRQVHFHLFMVEDRKIGGMQPLQQHAPHCRLRQGMVMALGTGIKGRAFHDSVAG